MPRAPAMQVTSEGPSRMASEFLTEYNAMGVTVYMTFVKCASTIGRGMVSISVVPHGELWIVIVAYPQSMKVAAFSRVFNNCPKLLAVYTLQAMLAH